MANNNFLWKPVSEGNGNLVILTPNSLNNQIAEVIVVTPDGGVAKGRFDGDTENGARGHYRFDRPGAAFPPGSKTIAILKDGSAIEYDTSNPSERYEGISGSRIQDFTEVLPNAGDSLVGADTSLGQAGSENLVGIQGPDGSTYYAPQVDYSGFSVPSLSNINVPFVDPIETASEVGAFNVGQFQQGLSIAQQNAMNLLELEVEGLAQFNQEARELQKAGVLDENVFNQAVTAAANKFNLTQAPLANVAAREEIGQANVFNQQQRLAAVDVALPEARDIISEGLERNRQLAQGIVPDTAQDRIFELTARNAAADVAATGGFGPESLVGQRTADIMSAEQRLNLQQIGEQGVQNFLKLGTQLNFDQPIKQNPIIAEPLAFTPQQATTASQIPGAPAQPASALAQQQQGAIAELSTISPTQALTSEIQQNQFQAELNKQVGMFNIESQVEEQLTQLNAEAFNAQQIASTQNLATTTARAEEAARQGREEARESQLINGIVGAGSAIGTALFNKYVLGDASKGAAGAAGAGSGAGAAGAGSGAGGAGAGAGAGAGGTAGGEAILGTSLSSALDSLATLPAGAQVGIPAAIATSAVALGISINDFVKGITDGEITENDVKQAIGAAGGNMNQFIADGVNKLFDVGVNKNDINNASLLANPLTAPFAFTDMVLGLDLDFSTGKGKDQQFRDAVRDHALDVGLTEVVDGKHMIRLSDGSAYNIGLDGGEKFDNYGTNVDGEKTRYSYEIDWSDPRAEKTVAWLNPVNTILFGADAGARFMGHMFNASISNNGSLSATKNNVRNYIRNVGLTYKDGVSILKQHRTNDNITEQDYTNLVAAWNDLMLNPNPSQEIVI